MCPHLWVHLCLFLRLLCQKMISPGPKTILAAAKHDSVHSKYKYMYKCIVIGTLGRGTSFMGLLMLVANAYWAKKWKKKCNTNEYGCSIISKVKIISCLIFALYSKILKKHSQKLHFLNISLDYCGTDAGISFVATFQSVS